MLIVLPGSAYPYRRDSRAMGDSEWRILQPGSESRRKIRLNRYYIEVFTG